MVARFTEQTHPELMHVPLKGDMLREFVKLASALSDYETLGMSKDASLLKNPDMQRVNTIVKAVSTEITRGLDSDTAGQFGVDMSDLGNIIHRCVGTHAEAIDEKDQAFRIRLQEDGSLNASNETLAQIVAAHLAGAFSMCLAIQENKERELLELHKQEAAATGKQLSAFRFSEDFNTQSAHAMLGSLIGGIISSELLIDYLKKTHSPAAGLYEQMAYGEEYAKTGKKAGIYDMLDQTFQLFTDIDISTHAGQEKLRSFKKQVTEYIRDEMGVSSSIALD